VDGLGGLDGGACEIVQRGALLVAQLDRPPDLIDWQTGNLVITADLRERGGRL
jgi:hypothetical protein